MFEDIKKAQLVEKIRVMAATGQSGEEIKKSLSKEELDLMKSFSNDIEKGKAAQIGEIRVWQGKKMRKQANGKWVEVSDKGMTKEQHSKKTDELSSKAGEQIGYAFHSKQASKLSDKEYDESEIDLENKLSELIDKENFYEKGKAAQVGEIRVWQGKKMRKQANGKWVEVSEYGMTKKEHLESLKRSQDIEREYERQGSKAPLHHKQEINTQLSASSKLSDKEYDESELEGGNKDPENKLEKLHNKGVDIYLDKDTGEYMYIAMKGDGTYGAYDINDNLIASERKRSDITSSYNLEPVKSTKNKDLENKLSELIDKENFYEKVAEHFGEPDDDGESESALIDRILSHGEDKVKKFIDSLK